MNATEPTTPGSEEPTARAPRPPASGVVDVLTAERDFLLRSIEDLDAERANGELDEARYEELIDGYTVQAATVLQALERARQTERNTAVLVARRASGWRRWALGAVLLALAVAGGGLLLARSIDQRQAGQTITGNAQSRRVDLADLARAARERPDDASAQLAYGRALLQANKMVDALKAFDAAARLDPTNAEAKAYGGWIVFLAGLTDDGLRRLDAAVATDATYPDAHFFRGMALLRGRQDRAGALGEFREFVRLAPAGPERRPVEGLIADLERPASSSSTTTTIDTP